MFPLRLFLLDAYVNPGRVLIKRKGDSQGFFEFSKFRS